MAVSFENLGNFKKIVGLIRIRRMPAIVALFDRRNEKWYFLWTLVAHKYHEHKNSCKVW